MYYDILKELIISVMYIMGFKTLSHIGMIKFISDFVEKSEYVLLDNLRKERNGITYYGESVSSNFLLQYENTIKRLIKKLKNQVSQHL